MAHHIEKHPTLPVIIRRYDGTLNVAEVDSGILSEDTDLINAQPNKVYYILDIRDLRLSLEELTKAGNMASRKSSNISNPNVIETLAIVPNRLLEIAAQGLRTATFGHLRVRAFRSMEDALAYVEQQTANS